MKKIRPVHVGIAIIFVLLSLIIVQWAVSPKSNPPATTELSAEADQPEEFPELPQNELYNSNAAPSFSEDPPPFKESRGQDLLDPKDPAVNTRKAEL